MSIAPIGRMLKWGEPEVIEIKKCETCGHRKSWHDNGRKCWGNPKVKGLCSAHCQKFRRPKK